MKTLQWHEICAAATAHIGKPSVYVNNGLEYKDKEDDVIFTFVRDSMVEIYGHNTSEYYEVMTHLVVGGLFFFETEEEQYRFYRVFEQPLTDSSAIYACTYNANGECQTENT